MLSVNSKSFIKIIESRQPLSDNYTNSGRATETVGATLLGFLGLGHHPELNPCNPRILLVPKNPKSMQYEGLSRITNFSFNFATFYFCLF